MIELSHTYWIHACTPSINVVFMSKWLFPDVPIKYLMLQHDSVEFVIIQMMLIICFFHLGATFPNMQHLFPSPVPLCDRGRALNTNLGFCAAGFRSKHQKCASEDSGSCVHSERHNMCVSSMDQRAAVGFCRSSEPEPNIPLNLTFLLCTLLFFFIPVFPPLV